ncbi:HET-domain-containing protein [Hypomontagnella monticulosa]|nr:HET-domain-containing protein [Hypomontagnella monticulosa]
MTTNPIEKIDESLSVISIRPVEQSPMRPSTWCDLCFNLSYAFAKSIAIQRDKLRRRCRSISIEYSALERSISLGCDFCAFLRGVADTYASNEQYDCISPPGDTYLYIPNSESGACGPTYEHIPAQRDIQPPNSEQSFNYLKSCLKKCTDEHDCWKQTILSPPRRLIHIKSLEGGLVELHETSDAFRKSYVALSYCWGDTNSLKTMKSNIRSLTDGFNLTQLSMAAQDAVHITWKLGLEYLWVDALCIVQDCDKDWAEQSAMMCSIYEQAYLTIVASSTSSADISFLNHPRPPNFQYRVASEPDLMLVARAKCRNGHHHDTVLVPPDPILTRGWALQESILSTRAIFYSTEELQWKCASGRSCECREEPARFQAPGLNQHKIPLQWLTIVLMYTERKLKFPKDKLPAMSGICQVINRLTGWHYLAGLWVEHLIGHLLWRRGPLNGDMQPPILTEFMAPTFSWASIDYPLSAFTTMSDSTIGFHEAAQLVDTDILLEGADRFGQVRPGSSITLRGKLAPVELRNEHNLLDYRARGIPVCSFIYPDTLLETFCFEETNGQPQRSVRRLTRKTNGQATKLESGNIVYLFLLAYDYSDCFCLVLGVSPSNYQAYERLGMAVGVRKVYKNFSHLPDKEVKIL